MNLRDSVGEVAPCSLVEKPAVEIAGDIPVRGDPVEFEPVKPGVDLAKTSGTSPPTSVIAPAIKYPVELLRDGKGLYGIGVAKEAEIYHRPRLILRRDR